ncbi:MULTISPECIES: T6SS immunity protein Tdi1 domain-containing protein [unclassified Arthrobacter]|uniref:T6SS immunity protein Tdi1 domain-containing protein n=1 Tax=unclassified Arthrobacter TaxID=235627 RepID=UPI002882FADD|nr:MULTISPECIES: T6SS immunity protein Tdi1 domain-containing protein [unclassified Arthrobacter]
MLEIFSTKFEVTDGTPGNPSVGSDTVSYLFARYGGCTFNNGLYRVHSAESSKNMARTLADAYPEFSFPFIPFGFDWLGRQFILDLRSGKRDPEILLLEPGTGYALEIPRSFSTYHDDELVRDPEPSLLPTFFHEWEARNTVGLAFNECAGYKVPLFLGGADSVDNLEVSDIEVYWSLMGQLRVSTQNLEPGTRIDGVEISD